MKRRWQSRRGRGFTLVEVMVGMIVLASILLILTAGERWLVLSSTRTSRWLLARDRGRRVLAFVEPRVLNCGLGLSGCLGGGALQRALGRGMPGASRIASWSDSFRGVRIYKDAPTGPAPATEEDGVTAGPVFCVLYTMPSGLVLRAPRGATLEPGGRVDLGIICGDAGNSGFRSGRFQDLRSWGVLPMTGLPFYIASLSARSAALRLADSAPAPVELPEVGELYLLRCERFSVINGKFEFQGMEADWYPPNSYPREDGILALWAEWRSVEKCLDLWVLASGGPSVFGGGRPAGWPEAAPWNDDFGRHELCVSRASWRLENL